MNYIPDKDEIKQAILSKLSRYFGTTPQAATLEQMYKAVVLFTRELLAAQYGAFNQRAEKQRAKKVYYLCMEFLIGKSLKNNLNNLGIAKAAEQAVYELGFSMQELCEKESDPGLGNGGLGRLAACFMDSLSTLSYPAMGFSICYEYGLFRQKILDGVQAELPDIWLPEGEIWMVPRSDRVYTVKFGGHISENWENGRLCVMHEDYDEVQAVPCDMMISGADSEAVNLLRLWKARDSKSFDMHLFSQGQYVKAVEENTNAEAISKVLYPEDNHTEGKILRLSQQYFLVSASVSCIIDDHLAVYGTLSNFSSKVAIHINDTHPALCIPELMRILIDTYSYSWEAAWYVVTKTVSYTNHTVLPEALETWNEDLFRFKLPRIYSIVKEINERFCTRLWQLYPGDWERISKMAIISYSQVRMANLSIVGSYQVNGVSKLHSDILKNHVFQQFYNLTPDKFTNVTNGIAHRRWLCGANPRLAALLDECIGPEYRHHPTKLLELKRFFDDDIVLLRLDRIKSENKTDFSNYLYKKSGLLLNPDSIYDVQVKRMHEYKRQLLNVLRIISLYVDLKENPDLDCAPQTFLFGAKAAPGYFMAKEIIKLIWHLGTDIEKDPILRQTLKVVFLEDYNVSLAERLIPAADISEQISLAGKEASGTGNMKLMINGAVTIGTSDGANVEIREAVGDENIFIFGLSSREVDELWKRGYSAFSYYQNNERLKKVVDALQKGFNGVSFGNIVGYLLSSYGIADPFMCLADFEAYYHAHETATECFQNRPRWNKMSLMNIASAGGFAADRSILEYAEKIWRIKSVFPEDSV